MNRLAWLKPGLDESQQQRNDATLSNAKQRGKIYNPIPPPAIIMRTTECLLQSLLSSFFAMLSWDEASWLGAALFLLEMEWKEKDKNSLPRNVNTHTHKRVANLASHPFLPKLCRHFILLLL